MILAAHYDPALYGQEPRIYQAPRGARRWRIEIDWIADDTPNAIRVQCADRMRLSEVIDYARQELRQALPDGYPVESASIKFWCGK